MKRRIVTALAASALCGAGLLAAPASNAAPAAATFNIYQHDDYKGGWYYFSGQDCDWRNNYWTNAGGAVTDGASSMKNATSRRIVMYSEVGCQGKTYYAQPYSNDSDLTNNGFDNEGRAADWL